METIDPLLRWKTPDVWSKKHLWILTLMHFTYQGCVTPLITMSIRCQGCVMLKLRYRNPFYRKISLLMLPQMHLQLIINLRSLLVLLHGFLMNVSKSSKMTRKYILHKKSEIGVEMIENFLALSWKVKCQKFQIFHGTAKSWKLANIKRKTQ